MIPVKHAFKLHRSLLGNARILVSLPPARLIPPPPLVPFDISGASSDLVGGDGTSSAFGGLKPADG